MIETAPSQIGFTMPINSCAFSMIAGKLLIIAPIKTVPAKFNTLSKKLPTGAVTAEKIFLPLLEPPRVVSIFFSASFLLFI